MYNILHLAKSRGMNDTIRPRRARPVVQPAGASHLTLILGDATRAAAPVSRRAADSAPPPRPHPSSG